MYNNGILTISKWNEGMKKHPVFGFGSIRNVEVFENPGIAKLKNRSVNSSFTFSNGAPNSEVYDVYGNIYTFDGEFGISQGSVYKNGTSIQSALSLPWDLRVYKDYLWISYSSILSCYGPLSSAGAQWFSSVASGFSSTSSGKLLVGQDDYLYRCNGNYIARIQVTASGTVGVAPTLSTNATALDLPDGQYAVTMVEYGTKIAIATCGASSYASRSNFPIARLYTWNRQLGTLGNPGLADLPVVFNENGMNAVIQHANKLFISAGTNGSIYVSDGANYQKIAVIPYAKEGISYFSTVTPNSISISTNGTLLVGISGTFSDITKPGIYEIDITDNKYPISYRIPSSTTTNNTCKIGFINAKDYQTLRFGWSNGSTYGVDITDYILTPSYGGVIETPLYRVGSFNNKKTFQHIEFYLTTPLVSGQNIRISYRKNDTDSYTTIGTWGYSTLGSVISWGDTAGVSDTEFIQLKIELDQATNTIYGSNINLLEVVLK